ncbi:hypothetical protein COY23_01895 [bacterium (Candidatus Torokbacteria) CG_4_10_14_0_2_um_filter_35_8]|nr:MAG: hypothetical protein COY23_01895 [bacterium (Candidatus Torokbacteria) CG_4_10_14_0_2_um_filter_35_8]
MFNSLKIEFEENEEVIAVIRKHPICLAKPIFVLIFFLVLISFFLKFFLASLAGFIILLVILCILLGYSLSHFLLWYFDIFLVTNQRLIDIDQKGIFRKEISETSLDKIQDVTYEVNGIINTIFGLGSVKVQNAGSKSVIEIQSTRNPRAIQELISSLERVSEQSKEKEMSASELVSYIKKLDKEPLENKNGNSKEEEKE